MTLTYRRDPISRTYRTTMPDGQVVTIRATGQRNGRMLGGAWIAETDRGPARVTIARGGTLSAVKTALDRIADAGTV